MPVMQDSYSAAPSEAYLGQLANTLSPFAAHARIARGYMDAGYGAFLSPSYFGHAGDYTTDPGEVYQRPSPAAAADVDAFITAITSSAGIQTLETTAFNGAVGLTEMYPGRKVSLVLSTHADWDATTAVVTGVSALTNQTVTENLAIPDGGNATVTGSVYFKSVSKIVIPAQSGVGGTATFGIAALDSLTAADFDGIVIRKPFKTTLSSSDLYRTAGHAAATTADVLDNETADIVRVGSIWVYCEEAVTERDPVFVRVASGAGGTHLGAFRNDADTSTAVELTRAKFRRRTTAAGLALVTLS